MDSRDPSRIARVTAVETVVADQARPSAWARAWNRHGAWVREIGLLVLLYATYTLTRAEADDDRLTAFRNADAVEWLERGMGIDVELAFNRLFRSHVWLADAASLWYQIAHFVFTFAVLVWVWKRHRARYSELRTGLALLWASGLAVYFLYPLAPPRFALHGAVDTMAVHPILFGGSAGASDLTNPYAAMPSLHVACSVWVAIAIVVSLRGPWRQLAWAYPAVMTVVVLGTANHYVLDCIAGAACAFAAYGLSRAIYRRVWRWRAEAIARDPRSVLEA